MNRPVKIILKVIIGIVIFLVTLVIGLYFFIQTETFNKWALEYTLSEINDSWKLKDNKIHTESLNGNILKGLKLNNGTITVKQDTILNFKFLDIKYDIWGLLDDQITLEYVILNSPRVNLVKTKNETDSLVWNFANLFSSSDEKDTSVSEFDWDVTVEKLKIENGFFRIVGEIDTLPLWVAQRPKLDTFNFNHLDVSNFELEMGARYYNDYKNISLKNLSFNTNSDFNIRKLKLDANINIKDTVTDLWGFELVTERTNAKLNKISMNKFNPFGEIVYEEFRDKNLEANINIETFNFADLNFFIPSLNILDSTAGLVLNASGKYGDLNVETLKLNLPNTEINIKGKVQNLHDPSKLYLDILAENLRIEPADLSLIYKDASLPNYKHLGPIDANIKYTGTLDNFYSVYDINTSAGLASGDINLNVDYENYRGNINTSNFNLGKVLNDNTLSSNLNMTAYFSGRGFDMNSLSTEINYHIHDSKFGGYDIKRSLGKVQAHKNNLSMNIHHISSMGNVLLNGRVNIANMKNPVYSMRGKVKNLDISKITKKSQDKSNLNFSFDIKGRGADVNNINGRYNVNFNSSFYSQYKIPATPLNIEINNSKASGFVKISSDMLDFNADGSFNISSITKVLQSNMTGITNSLTEKLNLDTLSQSGGQAFYVPTYEDLAVDYELIVKDTAKLEEILNPFGISFNGYLKGKLSNSMDGFTSAMNFNIDNFILNDTDIVLKNVTSNLMFKNNYTLPETGSLQPYSLDLHISGDKTVYGTNVFDSLDLDVSMNNSIMQLDIFGKQDSMKFVSMIGNIDLSGYEIVTKIDNLTAKYDKYEVANNNNWIINYSPDQIIDFENFSVKSKDIILNVKGTYSLKGNSDLYIQSDKLNPSAIMEYISTDSNSSSNFSYPVDGEISLNMNYKGNLEDPYLKVNINSKELKFQDSAIGKINADVEYKNEVATADISFLNNDGKGSLKILGDIPFQNPLLNTDTASTNFTIATSPVSLDFSAKDFQIEAFTKLIPNMISLSGVMNGKITAGGTVGSPELIGNLGLTDGQIFLGLTGMYYDYKLLLNTENSMLKIDNFSMANQGNNSRHLDLFGKVDFKGFKINNIDLSTSGDVVLLDETAVKNDLGIEGYFLGGIGNTPITIKGNLEQLDIGGQFLIKDAKISSIETKGSGYDAETDNFVYETIPAEPLFIDTVIVVSEEDLNKINPFERSKFKVVDDSGKTAGNINFDLNVKTEKNIYLSIDFKNLTRDRLFGEVSADLNLKTVGGEIFAEGSVNVLKNSYYRFYKDFKIDNSSVTFNGPLSDPLLNIRAVYEGTKVNEQYGTSSSFPVQVILTAKGEVSKPEIAIKLFEDGSEVSGSDAEADAITYLLFGRYKSELSTSERKTMASSVGTTLGSLYVTSFVSQTVREVLPFIMDAQFNYTEGKVKDTDVELTSEFGEATVKVGGKLLKEVKNFEFAIDYPLNKLLNLNLPETLILQISREEITNTATNNSQSLYNTGVKIAYKFKY